ncbi:MAG TPA: hypothetical protein VGP07_23780 [Polyangia bacterium]|jgi:hypothetical protein
MDGDISRGTLRKIEGRWRIFYDGYWVKAYDAPADSLIAKKKLIHALTRRLFNHVEHGINIPGIRLEEAQRAYDDELDPQKKRVKASMLAGALFNRAGDVFTKVVELQALGVDIGPDNGLLFQCGEYLQSALALGKQVRHRSGDEGIDELWGEPFKVFAFPIEDFYKSRYVKIAQTMRAIDNINAELTSTFERMAMFAGIEPLLRDFAAAAKLKSETLHTDADIFDVWASFVAAGERLSAFTPALPAAPSADQQHQASQGRQLVSACKDLVFYITRARVPMPKSTREFLDRCEHYRATFAPPRPRRETTLGEAPVVVGAAPPVLELARVAR